MNQQSFGDAYKRFKPHDSGDEEIKRDENQGDDSEDEVKNNEEAESDLELTDYDEEEEEESESGHYEYAGGDYDDAFGDYDTEEMEMEEEDYDSDLDDAILKRGTERERAAAISTSQLIISDEYELVHIACPVNGNLHRCT
jgi:hypothetical protein